MHLTPRFRRLLCSARDDPTRERSQSPHRGGVEDRGNSDCISGPAPGRRQGPGTAGFAGNCGKPYRVAAIVVPKPDSAFDGDALLAYCKEHLASFKCPKTVQVVADLPRNATGKVLKRQLREPFWTGRESTI